MKNISIVLLISLLCSGHFTLRSKTRASLLDRSVSVEFKASSSFTLLPHDTCLDKKFSIVFYVIQDSAYTLPNNVSSIYFPGNALPSYSLANIVNTLNQAFAPICVSFENCKTVIIPNYTYNRWTVGTTDSVILNNYYSPNTINIYIPTLLLNPPTDHEFAYSSPFPTGTGTPKDYIVLMKGMSLFPNSVNFSGSILLHAFGHYFGLPHTYAEIFTASANGPSNEAINGSNCGTNGDGFCDTEADPYPTGYNNSQVPVPVCYYKYDTGVADAGGTYYLPPVDNIMSNYGCRCRFTQDQYNYMARMIMTLRLYLH